MLSTKPPSVAVCIAKRTANWFSTTGMLITPVRLWLASLVSPPRTSMSALASNLLGSGLLVMTRRVPDWAAAPNSVPWGPESASVRATSSMRISGCAPFVWVIGISSRYIDALDVDMKLPVVVLMPRNTRLFTPGVKLIQLTLGMKRM